jgi:hypothetical protein
MSLQLYPEYFKKVLSGKTEGSKYFQNSVCHYNSAFAFPSFNLKQDNFNGGVSSVN